MVFNKIIIRLLGCLPACFSFTTGIRAQGAIQTMLQQIAALKDYAATAEKGYQIAENGVDAIGNIKKAEFSLHQSYFGSLQTTNPAIKDMPAVEETVDLLSAKLSQLSAAVDGYEHSLELGQGELLYIKLIQQSFIKMSENNLTILHTLTGNNLKMTDGERTASLEVLRNMVERLIGSIRAFITTTDLLITARQKQAASIHLLNKFYGIQ